MKIAILANRIARRANEILNYINGNISPRIKTVIVPDVCFAGVPALRALF